MISQIALSGFKSFVDESLDIRPLTVLTGLNSSGKSSVIQAIRMFDALSKGKSPLLEGHGEMHEMRSRLTNSMRLRLRFSNGEIMAFDGDVFQNGLSTSFPSVTYIGADRLGATSTIPVHTENYEIGEKGENVLKCLDYYRDRVLDERLMPEGGEGLTLDYMVKGWLGYIAPNVDFKYVIEPKADVSFSTFDGNRSANVGFGLSYTLPIIIALLKSTLVPDSIVLVENPEAHLHPRGQTEMGRLIGLCVDCGSQVIVETHSDHLFDGIRIHTKQTPGFSEFLLTYWFERNRSNGTSAQRVLVDSKGKYYDDCPRGFFDQFENNANALLF